MSLRFGGATDADWKQINRQGTRGDFHSGEIITARDAIENRRARMLLGGGGGMVYASPLEYDMTTAYAGSTWVHVGASNDAVTSGTIDPDSGLPVTSTAGWYCSCPGGVPIAGTEESPAYHIPQVPLPNSDTIDDSTNYWIIFIADAQCY